MSTELHIHPSVMQARSRFSEYGILTLTLQIGDSAKKTFMKSYKTIILSWQNCYSEHFSLNQGNVLDLIRLCYSKLKWQGNTVFKGS